MPGGPLLFKFGSNILIISLMLVFPAKVSLGETLQTSPSGQKYLAKKSFSFASNITHQFIGSRIITRFAPQDRLGAKIELQKLATDLGYDRFNWASYVVKDPYGISNIFGQPLTTPYNDPPLGGYHYDPADRFPFYWDIVSCQNCRARHHLENFHNLDSFGLTFEDAPMDYRLQPGEAIEFVTNLVGVKQHDFSTHRAEWEVLHTFRWQLANTHLNLSEASLLESDVALERLSPLLLKQMQQDGAINDY